MTKPDTLTDEERAEAFASVKYILDVRQDAKTLPLVLRNIVLLRDMAWLARTDESHGVVPVACTQRQPHAAHA